MSNADRQKAYRDRKRNAQRPESVTRVTVDEVRNAQLKHTLRAIGGAALRSDIRIGFDVYYHPRTHPERLNWGEHMTGAQLEDAGLVANRVSIPGDYDYVGVCQC